MAKYTNGSQLLDTQAQAWNLLNHVKGVNSLKSSQKLQTRASRAYSGSFLENKQRLSPKDIQRVVNTSASVKARQTVRGNYPEQVPSGTNLELKQRINAKSDAIVKRYNSMITRTQSDVRSKLSGLPNAVSEKRAMIADLHKEVNTKLTGLPAAVSAKRELVTSASRSKYSGDPQMERAQQRYDAKIRNKILDARDKASSGGGGAKSGGKGKGRGNWGHKGRPGVRGGSA